MKVIISVSLILSSIVSASSEFGHFAQPVAIKFSRSIDCERKIAASLSFSILSSLTSNGDALNLPVPSRYPEEDEEDGQDEDDYGFFDSAESYFEDDEDQQNIEPLPTFLPGSQGVLVDPHSFNISDLNALLNSQFEFINEKPLKPSGSFVKPSALAPRSRVSSATSTFMMLDMQRNVDDLDRIRGY